MITFKDGLKIDLPDLLATQALASALAAAIHPGLCIYLEGDLGAGKTTFVRGVLNSLGYNASIKSPTYTLVESYGIDGLDLYHFDLYRLADPSELDYIGLRDYMTENAVCFFEWANKGAGHIPAADIEMEFHIKQTARVVVFTANTKLGLQVLQALTIGT